MNAKKKCEADDHVRQAEKALKTSLTKWTPDHDSAGDEFSKAATCYKVAKCYPDALKALSRACDCYKECRSLYQAAKMLEQAVIISKEANQLDQVASLAERGGLLYRQHGSPESAAQLLEKAAKILESSDSTKALQLYEKAAETIMVEDRPKQAADLLTKVGRMQVKNEMWESATETLESSIKLLQESGSVMTVGRIVAGLVLVQLAREDVVAASKVFQTWGGYCDSDQASAINTIIDGFSDEDGDMARQGLSSSAIKNLDIEFARMSKNIKVPEGGGLEAAAAKIAAERTQEPPPLRSATSTEHSYGVDPVAPKDLGETKEQREEDIRQQQRELEEEEEAVAAADDDDDDDEGLC